MLGIFKKVLFNLIKRTFSFWQRLGINITRNYFYSTIPDLRELKDEIWTKFTDLKGIDINENRQLELLSNFKTQFKDEYDKFLDIKIKSPNLTNIL